MSLYANIEINASRVIKLSPQCLEILPACLVNAYKRLFTTEPLRGHGDTWARNMRNKFT